MKAIIFDRDGVLVDSNQAIIYTYQKTGKILGQKVPSKDFFRKKFGIIYSKVLEKAYGKNEKVFQAYREAWSTCHRKIKRMPGLNATMKKIKFRKAIVTTGSMLATKIMLKDSLKYFPIIIAREATRNHKPDAEPLLLACKKLKIKPREAVYVGDSVIDYKTARNAGTQFIGFLSNGSTKKEFRQAGAMVTVKSLNELPKVLEKF